MIKYWTKQIGGTLKIDTAKVSDFHIWQTEIPPDLKFFLASFTTSLSRRMLSAG